jgi:hypothetical protein
MNRRKICGAGCRHLHQHPPAVRGRNVSRFCLWFRIPQGPGPAEHNRPPLWTGLGQIFGFVLKEKSKPFRRKYEIGLKANSVHGVKRQTAGSALVRRDLPLIISDYAELQQSTEILLQRNNLSQSPLIRKGLAGRDVGAFLLAVELRVGKKG